MISSKNGYFLFVLFSFFLTIIGCVSVSSQNQSPAKKIDKAVAEFPYGYQDWVNPVSKVVLDLGSDFYGFQRVLVNKDAMYAYTFGGPYLEGSQLVLEFSEPIFEGPEGKKDIVKGPVNWFALMTRNSLAKETGGWIFEAYDGLTNTRRDIDPVAECYSCNLPMKGKDYVYSSKH